MDKKYLCNGRRVRLTELSDNDLGFDPQRPIVIYDRRIESEVGTGSFGNLPLKVSSICNDKLSESKTVINLNEPNQ